MLDSTHRIVASAVAAALLSLTGHSVEAQVKARLDLPAQPLVDTLKAIASQNNLNIFFEPRLIAGRRAPALSGDVNIEDALSRALAGTNLTYRRIDENTISILSVGVPESRNKERELDETGDTREEQTEPAAHIANPASQSLRFAEAGRFSPAAADGSLENDPEKLELQEIVVTGSHIRNAEPAGSKLIVIDRQQIERSGYGRVQDLLETLPQNFAGINEDSSQSFVQNQNHGAEIQLRGLGAGTTLTLVNGQRQAGGGTLGAFVDISSIPSSAIERVEVLTDGASAIYGSDAIGGVVNFVLRKDYEGAETRLRSATSGGDADELQVSQLLGTNWMSGHALFGYQYFERDPLLYGSRPYYANGGDQRSFGGSDFRRTSPLRRGGSPGNILNSAGQVAFAIPSGQDGTSLTAAQLLPGAINYQDSSYATILPEQKMHSAFMSASQDLGERLELVADARYSTREMMYIVASSGSTVSVPSSNPFYVNPFGGTGNLRVEYDFASELGPYTSMGTTDTVSGHLGLVTKLNGDWRLTWSGLYGKERTDWVRENRIDTVAVAAALADTNPVTALNVFGDGTANNPTTLAGLRYSDVERGISTVWSVSAIADGPLFAMPGGLARLAAGVDYRDESLDVLSNFTLDGLTHNSRSVVAGFAELAMPIIGPEVARPGVHRLEISVAARYDEYNDFGSTFNPKVGLVWSPIERVNVRGTWGSSFRAPPFFRSNPDIVQTFPSITTVNVPGQGSTVVLRQLGVIPDLKEETAKVWTAGLDITPIDALSVSLSYFDIAYRDKIQSPLGGPAVILANASQFAAVINADPTQAEIDAICATSLVPINCTQIDVIVDERQRNLAVVDVRGIDFEVQYSLATSLGDFRPSLGGTYLFGHEQAVTESSPVVDVSDTLENPLSLRLRGALSWNLRNWNAGVTVNYAGAYHNTGTVPETIDSWTTVNLSAGYQFPDGTGWLKGARIQVGAVNVLDEQPPFVNQFQGYDPANGNVIGRTLSLQLTKAWAP